MRNFKDFTRAIAGIATAFKNINTVVEAIPVPGGSVSTDYSSTPHIVGKWVDGTTDVYEISLEGTTNSSDPTFIDMTSELPDGYVLDKLIAVDASVDRVGYSYWYNVPAPGFGVCLLSDKIRLEYTNNAGYGSAPYVCTIRYTLKASE